ncbi:hypothetical protein BCR35DRAFT_304309 [Leucosporidium creatinivorum]|uniref:Uncharacterized protein n=1 Tax=Leucosporidium creatinivorum TaxID=106004 RepID=A0A1Y2FA04_9BASI|nr:hypothetical protein BCR35DRAFT_304309 [Leucosporidium creatinivorum]
MEDDPRLLSRAHLLAIRDQVYADEVSLFAKQLVEHAFLTSDLLSSSTSQLNQARASLASSLASSSLDRERQQVDYEILERQAQTLARKLRECQAGGAGGGGVSAEKERERRALKSDVKHLQRRLDDSTTQLQHLTLELRRLRAHALSLSPSVTLTPSFVAPSSSKAKGPTMGDAAAEHLLLASRSSISSINRIERVPLSKVVWEKAGEIVRLGAEVEEAEGEGEGRWEEVEKQEEERRVWKSEKEMWERERGRAGTLPWAAGSGRREKGKGKEREREKDSPAPALDFNYYNAPSHPPPSKRPRTSLSPHAHPQFVDPSSTHTLPRPLTRGRPTSALDVLAQASSFSHSQESQEMEMLEGTDVEDGSEAGAGAGGMRMGMEGQESSSEDEASVEVEMEMEMTEAPSTDVDAELSFSFSAAGAGGGGRRSIRPSTARASKAVQERLEESEYEDEQQGGGGGGVGTPALKENKEGEWTSVRQPYLKCRQRFLRGLKSGSSIPRALSHLTQAVREKVREHERKKRERRAKAAAGGRKSGGGGRKKLEEEEGSEEE